MVKYTNEILGMNYIIEKDSKEDLEEWLVTKLEKDRFTSMEKRILQRLLGMDKLLDRIKTLEEKIK